MLLSRVQGMSPRSCEGFLAGTLNRMLNMCVLRAAGVAPAKPCSELSRDEVNALAKCLKHFNVNVLGGQDFKSAQVMRGGAALVIAGLAAQGETQVMHPQYIDRGYAHFEENLRALGADVYRI